jgi:hypothetical protein
MLNISADFHFPKLDQILNSWGNFIQIKFDATLENDKLPKWRSFAKQLIFHAVEKFEFSY